LTDLVSFDVWENVADTDWFNDFLFLLETLFVGVMIILLSADAVRLAVVVTELAGDEEDVESAVSDCGGLSMDRDGVNVLMAVSVPHAENVIVELMDDVNEADEVGELDLLAVVEIEYDGVKEELLV
jgi:hypothetical protein